MFRRFALLALLGVVALSHAGCPSTLTASYQVTNVASGVLVMELYVCPSGSASTGPNRLAQPLYPGETFTVTGLVPGYYDGLAVVYLPLSDQWAQLPNPLVELHSGQTYTQSIYYTNSSVPSLKDDSD